MPPSEEREQARLKLIESAALYLDAARLLEAVVLAPLPAGANLEIHLRVLPGDPEIHRDLSSQGANL